MDGVFISFEGNDGSGKTTVIEKCADVLTKKGYQVLVTREPGGTNISEQIREIILNKENKEMDVRTEALLYAASRRQHIAEVIIPALAKGYIILCDRFIDSSLAYQGHARGIGIDKVFEMNMFACEGLLPSLTVYIDVNPEVGFSRMKKDCRKLDRLELEAINFHKTVYQGYQELVKRFPNRIVSVNGDQNLEQVSSEVIDLVLKHIKK
ncbi:MAG TPA: dTMP kinase [Acholeplasmataceae bacterium]|jgi:dTMP kinase|nr:dTMP kinase [Acholeplasmataceae bacterium]